MPRKGMTMQAYADRRGVKISAVAYAKTVGRLVLFRDGSINPDASDERWAAMTDPAQSAKRLGKKLGAGESGEPTLVDARMRHEVVKAEEKELRLAKMRGDLVDKRKAIDLVARLAREERDAWQTWPARVAGEMASALGVDVAAMQKALEQHVDTHLGQLADTVPELR